MKCAICRETLDGAESYSVDDKLNFLCTACWMQAVMLIPDCSGGETFWRGSRYVEGALYSCGEFYLSVVPGSDERIHEIKVRPYVTGSGVRVYQADLTFEEAS